jgi:hypothetical protein
MKVGRVVLEPPVQQIFGRPIGRTRLHVLLSVRADDEVSSTPGILIVSLPPSSKLKRRAGLLVRPSDDMRNPSGTTTRMEDFYDVVTHAAAIL